MLVLTDEVGSAQPVIDEIERRGLPVAVIQPSEMSDKALRLSVFSDSRSRLHGLFRSPSGEVHARPGARIWKWKVAYPGHDSAIDVDPAVSEMKAAQYRAALRAVWEIDAEWMNPYVAEQRLDQNKALGAVLARKCGLRVPDTVITDDPEVFKSFVQSLPQSFVAVKAASAWAARRHDGSLVGAYTVKLSKPEAVALAESVRFAPVIAQPYIDKLYEIRVTCVASKFFACRIDSQANRGTEVDWRIYPDDPVGHSVLELRPEWRSMISRFMKAAGLLYGAIDFIMTPRGELVFLEVNPAGQYLWIEKLTGLPISAAIADWLCSAPNRVQQD